MTRVFYIFSLLLILSCNEKKEGNPHILIVTAYGDIEAELYRDKAPKTVAAFLSSTDAGFYNKSSFYRVLKAEEMPTDYNSGLIQGGLWPNEKKMPGIPHESTRQSHLSHTNGIISMARPPGGAATTEFFICIGDQTQYDAGNGGTKDSLGYSAFGKIIKGMNAVRKMQENRATEDKFNEKIPIDKIKHL